jgi:hypothetical protein
VQSEKKTPNTCPRRLSVCWEERIYKHGGTCAHFLKFFEYVDLTNKTAVEKVAVIG